MDEQLQKLIDTLEWLKSNKEKLDAQGAFLRQIATPAVSEYRLAVANVSSGMAGFTAGSIRNHRQEAQRAVLKAFNSIFKYIGPRKTSEVKLSGPLCGQGDYRMRIVTIGSFGFGTKRTPKSKSQRVDDWAGVTFILMNASSIAVELKKMGQGAMADLLTGLYETVPITCLMDYPTFVRTVPDARKVIGSKGPEMASTLMLQITSLGPRWYVDVPLEFGSERISLLGDDMASAKSYGSSLVAYQQFSDVVPLLVEDAKARIAEDAKKVEGLREKIQAKFGNYLLGVQL